MEQRDSRHTQGAHTHARTFQSTTGNTAKDLYKHVKVHSTTTPTAGRLSARLPAAMLGKCNAPHKYLLLKKAEGTSPHVPQGCMHQYEMHPTLKPPNPADPLKRPISHSVFVSGFSRLPDSVKNGVGMSRRSLRGRNMCLTPANKQVWVLQTMPEEGLVSTVLGCVKTGSSGRS